MLTFFAMFTIYNIGILATSSDLNKLVVYVDGPMYAEAKVVKMKIDATVADLKNLTDPNILTTQLLVMHGGRSLVDHQLLADLDVCPESVVEVIAVISGDFRELVYELQQILNDRNKSALIQNAIDAANEVVRRAWDRLGTLSGKNVMMQFQIPYTTVAMLQIWGYHDFTITKNSYEKYSFVRADQAARIPKYFTSIGFPVRLTR